MTQCLIESFRKKIVWCSTIFWARHSYSSVDMKGVKRCKKFIVNFEWSITFSLDPGFMELLRWLSHWPRLRIGRGHRRVKLGLHWDLHRGFQIWHIDEHVLPPHSCMTTSTVLLLNSIILHNPADNAFTTKSPLESLLKRRCGNADHVMKWRNMTIQLFSKII